MPFKIKLIRSKNKVTEEDIKSKEFNIWVGISLENKWFNKENLKEYILWALKYSKSGITVLIADTLHAVNYEVIDDYNHNKAYRRTIREGDKTQKIIEGIISELPKLEQKSVNIARWEDINNKERAKEKQILYKEFRNNKKFREEIRKIVISFTDRLSEKFSQESVDKLATYILDELPELLSGFKYKGTHYNLYPYPKNTAVAEFVEKIQKKDIFPELHKKIKIINNVCVWLA